MRAVKAHPTDLPHSIRCVLIPLHIAFLLCGLLLIAEGGILLTFVTGALAPAVICFVAGGLGLVVSIFALWRDNNGRTFSYNGLSYTFGALLLLAFFLLAAYATSQYVAAARDRTSYARDVWNSLKPAAREQYERLKGCSGLSGCLPLFEKDVATAIFANMIAGWILVGLSGLAVLLVRLQSGQAETTLGPSLELGQRPLIYEEANHLIGTGGQKDGTKAHEAPDDVDSWIGFYTNCSGPLPANCPCLDNSKGGIHPLDTKKIAGAHVYVKLESGGVLFGITPTCSRCNFPGPMRRALPFDQTRGFNVAVMYRASHADEDPSLI